MKIGLFSLTSPIHDLESIEASSNAFLARITAASGSEIVDCGNDFSRYGHFALSLIFMRTGGTEESLRLLSEKLPGPYYLLASSENNSLAAALEALAYLRARGERAEILHGEGERIARRMDAIASVRAARNSLRGLKLGVVGKPANWLIASETDYAKVQRRLGVELIDIEIKELQELYRTSRPADPARLRLEGSCDARRMEDALRIYTALHTLCDRYGLGGLTLRCFDLLFSIRTTGCVAVAALNREGITAACEGDIPALLSMVVLRALSGRSSFQANPASIDPELNRVVLAHCTVPFDMTEGYRFDTHFESGLGVAVAGRLPLGDATLFKCSGDLERYFVSEGRIVAIPESPRLCRTQVVAQLEKSIDYFLHDAIGNHHILAAGRLQEPIDAFFADLNAR